MLLPVAIQWRRTLPKSNRQSAKAVLVLYVAHLHASKLSQNAEGWIARCARDPLRGGFTKIKNGRLLRRLCFFICKCIGKPVFHTSTNKKQVAIATCLFDFGSGGWIRTNDLRVMSPTSYLCSTPHYVISLWKSSAKVLLFPDMTKRTTTLAAKLTFQQIWHSTLQNCI